MACVESTKQSDESPSQSPQALVLESTEGAVRRLTLNRPERRNALSLDLIAALRAALKGAAEDREIGAVLLTGLGRLAFSSGADLGQRKQGGAAEAPAQDGPLLMHPEGRAAMAGLLTELHHLSKPTVAAAVGSALAGGLGLVLCCDLAVVNAQALYGVPEIKHGLFPMLISPFLLRALGHSRTRLLSLTGRLVEGATLAAWGAVAAAVPESEVAEKALSLAQDLAAGPAAIVKLGRQALEAIDGKPLAWAMPELENRLSAVSQTPEAQEGMAAYQERRTPQFARPKRPL